MKKIGPLLSCVLLIAALAGCEEATGDATGTLPLTGDSALVLPPGHPGTVSGSTILMPGEATPPLIHYANCFAGVPGLYDFGIGSSAGATRTYRGYAILPVNINLGDTVLGFYRIRVDVTDPALRIDLTNITGSNPLLGAGSCVLRGCPSGCENSPGYFPPDEFLPAQGFEAPPTPTGTAAGVTVEAADTDPGNPTTGVINLCNIRVNVVGDLPAGGAAVNFTVDELRTAAGDTIAPNPLSGIFIENFQIQ